jgi:hypothetical protein
MAVNSLDYIGSNRKISERCTEKYVEESGPWVNSYIVSVFAWEPEENKESHNWATVNWWYPKYKLNIFRSFS